MKEKLRITIIDKNNNSKIIKDFKAYNFYDLPFLDLAKEYNLNLKENTSQISKKLKRIIIEKTSNQELKTILIALLSSKKFFNPAEYQTLLNALSNYKIGSFEKILNWLNSNKSKIYNSSLITFERLMI